MDKIVDLKDSIELRLRKMSASSFPPPPSILSFTETAASISELRQSHAHMLKTGLLHDPFSAGRLISSATALSQTSSDSLLYAHSIFTDLQNPNSYSYNTLIRAYANSPTPENSFSLFRDMLFDDGVTPDNYTFTFVLKASSVAKSVDFGKQVHSHVIKSGFEDNAYICNTLIHMYAKGGFFDIARNLLDKMSERNVISWNAILSAYVDTGMMELAHELFDEMPERNVESGNFMISGYIKIGLINEARRIFDDMPVKDISTWNSMISGLGLNGYGESAIELFHELLANGFKPNEVTFVSILSACSRSGLLNEGQKMFELMVHTHRIKPTIEHYECMVDLLGKFGLLNEAEKLAKEVFFKESQVVWESLLVACISHNDDEMAERVAKKLLELDPCESFVSYV